MGSGKLLIPSIADMNLTIPETIAISKQEMIAKALIAPTQMTTMNRLGRTEGLPEMMDDNSSPTISIDRAIKHEDRIIRWTLLEIAQVGQGKAGRFSRGIQIQQHDHGGHGRKETSKYDLRASGDGGLGNVASVLGHLWLGSAEEGGWRVQGMPVMRQTASPAEFYRSAPPC